MDGPQTHALADHLHRLLTGSPVDRIDVPQDRWQANVLLMNCTGQVIQRIHSRGQWLQLDFSHGITWLCQMIAKSRWQLNPTPCDTLPPSTEKKSPARQPLLKLTFRNQTIALLLGRPVFLILPTQNLSTHADLKNLGPDPLLAKTFEDDFAPRLRSHPNRTLAAALLDQEIVAGIGNALKCEILFAAGYAPATRVSVLLHSDVSRLATKLQETYLAATTAALKNQLPAYRVYDRAGEPCLLCNTEILADRSGLDHHLSWHCPHCQPQPTQPTLF